MYEQKMTPRLRRLRAEYAKAAEDDRIAREPTSKPAEMNPFDEHMARYTGYALLAGWYAYSYGVRFAAFWA